MKLLFNNVRVDGRLETDWEALLRPVARFEIEVRGVRWYEEEEFCLIEFAAALADWLDRLSESPKDFTYTSLESAEPELLRFAHVTVEGWRILSPHSNYCEAEIFSTAQLVTAAKDYLRRPRHGLPSRRPILELLSERPLASALEKTLKDAWSRDGLVSEEREASWT